jgi:hypothetical protein
VVGPKADRSAMSVTRIVSGGQTGADQAGLAVARRLGIPTGGTMPKGFLTEDGPRPDLAREFGLEAAPSPDYPARAELNVIAADGTVIFGDARSRGSLLTAELCGRHGRPCLVVAPGEPVAAAAGRLRAWLDANGIRTLNVAGNRASQAPGIGSHVEAVLGLALGADCRDDAPQPPA